MKCPDPDRLVDFALQGGDPEFEAHIESCSECRSVLRLLREIPLALRPAEPLSDRLQALAMSAIEAAREEEQGRLTRVPALQVAGSGVLGFLTAVAVLVGSGAVEVGGLLPLLGYSLAVGVAVSLHRAWASGGAAPAEA